MAGKMVVGPRGDIFYGLIQSRQLGREPVILFFQGEVLRDGVPPANEGVFPLLGAQPGDDLGFQDGLSVDPAGSLLKNSVRCW